MSTKFEYVGFQPKRVRAPMEFGIYTFADLSLDSATGTYQAAHERIKHLIEEIELADEVGLDVFAVGERHRP